MDNVAQITNLCKTFKSPAITAIDGLTLSLPKGEVIGLVGPYGAGKTTLIRLLLGLLVPSSGKISVLGLNPATHTHELHQKIGYMLQKFGLYEDLSVKENMNLYAELKGLTEQEKNEQFEWLLKFTGLKPFTSRLAGNLSGGVKQKLGLGCTLLGKPEFLLLDEPGVVVAPISRRELMKMVYSLRDQGITVLWSTSYLDEAEYCDRIALIYQGQAIKIGTPDELKNDGEIMDDAFIRLIEEYNKRSGK